MNTLITKVIELFKANVSFANVDGPYLNESPSDRPAGDYCVFTATTGPSQRYLTNDGDESRSATIVFSLYTPTAGHELDFLRYLDGLYDHKSFDLSNGRCDLAKRISASVRNAGQTEQRERLYVLTYAAKFDFHVPSSNNRNPVTETPP